MCARPAMGAFAQCLHLNTPAQNGNLAATAITNTSHNRRPDKHHFNSSGHHALSPLMTDLLHTIPDFPTKQYTHLLPSLEKNLITTTDLLTLDALEVAKRAQLPLLDVRRLASHVLAILQGQLGLKPIQGLEHDPRFENVGEGSAGFGALRKSGQKVLGGERNVISTLDENVDKALGGGIPTGYITEITGERFAFLQSPLITMQAYD